MRKQDQTVWPIFTLLLALVWGAESTAQLRDKLDNRKKIEKLNAAQGADFIRLRKDASGNPLALETAIVRYQVRYPSKPGDKPGDKPGKKEQVSKTEPNVVVDLVGVVHVGEKDYYQRLNKTFEQYDVLLYELVAAKGAEVPQKRPQEAAMHPVAALQYGLKSMLGLEFQLDIVDYTKKNFVHADLSPEEFASSMARRGESFWKLYFRMLGAGIAQQAKDPSGLRSLRLNLAFFGKDRSWKLKRALAEQFQDINGVMRALEGKDGSTLISERNKRALQVLREQIKAGKRRIGIFYGAGHMPDMDRRLQEEFGLKPVRRTWLRAWKLQKD